MTSPLAAADAPLRREVTVAGGGGGGGGSGGDGPAHACSRPRPARPAAAPAHEQQVPLDMLSMTSDMTSRRPTSIGGEGVLLIDLVAASLKRQQRRVRVHVAANRWQESTLLTWLPCAGKGPLIANQRI